MKPAVRLEGLHVTREKTPILVDVTADIPAGKVVGLLGPSGAGKTTLIRTIVGLQKPTQGRATVLDQPAGSAGLRRRIGYVTQTPAIYNDLSVQENLKYFGAMRGVGGDDVKTVISAVRLNGFEKRLVGSLSGGQRARVSLAVALLGKPPLLVLDEPTVGLDPVLREELWRQFHELADAGATLLISSHVMDEANRCDELLLVRDGHLLAAGSPADLRAQTNAGDIEAAFLKLVEGTA